jgi:glycosyltransferase involved in cell wall biosynthesis
MRPTIVLFLRQACLGGAELNALRIFDFLRQNGYRALLVTSERGALFERFCAISDDQLVVAFPFPRKPLSWLRIPEFLFKVSRFLRKYREQQVLFSSDFYTLWATLFFRSSIRPVVSLWQGEYCFKHDKCVRKWIQYGALKADLLLASAPVAAHANKIGLLQSPIHTLNPSVDELNFNPSLYKRSKARVRLGWSDSEHVAVCIGRIGAGKGQMWLARSFINDPRFSKAARLVIVGPGNAADLNELKSMSVRSGGRLTVLGSRSDIPEILAAADLSIQPGTLEESFGLAALETCLMDVPLLAFAVGALPLILGFDYPGLISPSESSNFIEKWIKLSSNQLPSWGKGMRASLLAKYGEQVWKKQLIETFNLPSSKI